MKFGRRIASLKSCLPKMGTDALLVALAYLLAFLARLERLEHPYDQTLLLTLPFVVMLKVSIFHYVGSYRGLWHYSGLVDLRQLVWGTVLSTSALTTMAFLLPRELIPPRSVPLIDAVFTLVFLGGARVAVRLVYESATETAEPRRLRRMFGWSRPDQGRARRALIVGAGDTGEAMARDMLRGGRLKYVPVAFVDDNPTKLVQRIHGVPVRGTLEQIPGLVRELGIDEILIAIPSASGPMIQRILHSCRDTSGELRILSRGSNSDGVAGLRKLKVEDLLGRQPANLDVSLISSYLRGKRVLVTGAGGSIGSEICKQILEFAPSELQLLGRGEHSIYEVHQELRRAGKATHLVQIIGDVINKRKLEAVFSKHRPEIVFHAGADKHVPLMELNPDEAVLNNILGTQNVLEVADAHGVERVVCISTDKAVTPQSVMGCCKRVGELLVQSGIFTNTIAVAVRFANVLASRGSVIPLFQRQLRDGGPITVTSREITRYFMTIPEAASLVIQAGAMGRGGEIFVLDMGEPLKIWDLAHDIVRMSGLKPGEDVEIVEVGLRPGEKMNEELTYPDEIKKPTAHPRIVCVEGQRVDHDRLRNQIQELTRMALSVDEEGIRRGLRHVVPQYEPAIPVERSPLSAAPRHPARPAPRPSRRPGRWAAKPQA